MKKLLCAGRIYKGKIVVKYEATKDEDGYPETVTITNIDDLAEMILRDIKSKWAGEIAERCF